MATGRYHWSNTANSATLFKINAVAFLPLLALILHPSWGTLYGAVGTIVVLAWIEIGMGLTIPAFVRSINIAVTGRVKPAINIIKEMQR